MEFRVLGPLEVDANGESQPLGGQKQRGLLAILLLNANQVVSTDRLIDELWGGEAPETAQKALQVHVSQLRKVLEPNRASAECRLLVTRSPGYLLQVELGQLDLGRFERLAAEGREALAKGDPELAAERLREALSLWRGPPLAEFAYVDFAQREIARLEELRLVALEDRIQADLDRGRHADVIGELERLVSEESLRERPRGQLMLALYRSGRQAEALEVFRESREALVDELGIEPGRRLQELHAAILSQDPSLDAAPRGELEREPEAKTKEEGRLPVPAGATTPEPATIPEFVGREAELRDLEVALERALLGRGSVFLIGGEPGIGKSSLAGELAQRALPLDAQVLWGRCWEAGGAPAYWPWVQSLRSYVGRIQPETLQEQLGSRGGEVAHVLPELREVLPDLPVLEWPDSEGARFRVFDATTTFLKRSATVRPLVLVLEDLHAADASSLLLLQFVTREIADARLLIVGTYRDIELGPGNPLSSALVELNRQQSTRTLLLRGVRERDVSRLIEISVGVSPPRRAAVAIYRATGGNPLFVGELARLLVAEGKLDEPVDEVDLRLAIPRGVREVIARRLVQVSEGCRETLGTAAVLGREFTIDALAHVGGRAPGDVLSLLDEAITEGVVVEAPGSSRRLHFSHELIRDALYDELGASRRMYLHRQIGDALEDLYRDDPDPHLAELAHHFFEAGPGGDARRAYDYAGKAGDRAARLLAYEEAVRLYQLAMRMLESAPANDVERCETLLALGDAQLRAGDEEGAKETFLAAAGLARRTNAAERLAHAALGYGGRYWMAARGDRMVIPLLEEALASLEAGDSALRAKLMARLACAIRDQPSRERRLPLSEDAVEMARRVADPPTLAFALAARCIALAGPDNLEAFGETAAEAVRLGESVGDPEAELTGHWWRVRFELELGNTSRARQELAIATRLAEEAREPAYRWYRAGLAAALALFEGRFDDAAEQIAEAYELGRNALMFNAVCSYRLQMFVLHRQRGEPPYQVDALTRLVADHETYTILHCALASHLLSQGREADARRVFEELAADDFERIYVDEEYCAAMTLLAELCCSLGDMDRAGVLYPKLLPYRGRNAWGFPEIVLGSVERPLGILAALLGRGAEAEGHFERALKMNASMGARPWVAHTQHDYARMLIRRGARHDAERASELLRAACSGYEELGMPAWQASAAADLASIA